MSIDVDTSKPLNLLNASTPPASLSVKVSPELNQQMQSATTFEALKICWEQLNTFLILNKFKKPDLNDTNQMLIYYLSYINSSVQNPRFESENHVQTLIENGYLEKAEQIGIPAEFLYETIRLTWLKKLEREIARSQHHQIYLVLDNQSTATPNESNFPAQELVWYNWANQQLEKLWEERKSAGKKAVKVEDERQEINRKLLSAYITQYMHPEKLTLSAVEVNLLELHWLHLIKLWKEMFQKMESEQTILNDFLKFHGDKQITPELFTQLKTAYAQFLNLKGANDLSSQEGHLQAFDLLDPSSSWFFICIKGIQAPITLNKFQDKISNNHTLADWGI